MEYVETSQVVNLSGELDYFQAPLIRQALDKIAGPAIIDISQVSVLSSSGLTELLRVAKRIGPRKITLAGARSTFRDLLYRAHFDDHFIIID